MLELPHAVVLAGNAWLETCARNHACETFTLVMTEAVKAQARFSDLKIGIRELSVPFM